MEDAYFSHKQNNTPTIRLESWPTRASSLQGLDLPVGMWNIKRILTFRIPKELRLLTGVQPSLSGELSGDGGSTTMLVTLQV